MSKHIGSNFDDFLNDEDIEYKIVPYNPGDYIINDEEVAKILLHKATSFDLFEEILEKAKTINLAKIEDNYHLDFGGYCGVKAATLYECFILAIKKIDNFKGFDEVLDE
jgi:hypothetical protein